jgi:hypothetical protein
VTIGRGLVDDLTAAQRRTILRRLLDRLAETSETTEAGRHRAATLRAQIQRQRDEIARMEG